MPKGLRGFQKGHPPFWLKGNPGNKHSKFTGAPGQGYQKGHRPFYTGGAVMGHAPTNTKPTMYPGHPSWKLDPYAFGQPLGEEHRKRGGNRPKDKERACLEAIQNGTSEPKLLARFPAGMVKRLSALHKVAEDSSHKDWINAMRMVREILTHLRGVKGEDDRSEDASKPDVIQIAHGHVEKDLPGNEKAPAPDGRAQGPGEGEVNPPSPQKAS